YFVNRRVGRNVMPLALIVLARDPFSVADPDMARGVEFHVDRLRVPACTDIRKLLFAQLERIRSPDNFEESELVAYPEPLAVPEQVSILVIGIQGIRKQLRNFSGRTEAGNAEPADCREEAAIVERERGRVLTRLLRQGTPRIFFERVDVVVGG